MRDSLLFFDYSYFFDHWIIFRFERYLKLFYFLRNDKWTCENYLYTREIIEKISYDASASRCWFFVFVSANLWQSLSAFVTRCAIHNLWELLFGFIYCLLGGIFVIDTHLYWSIPGDPRRSGQGSRARRRTCSWCGYIRRSCTGTAAANTFFDALKRHKRM